MATSTIVQDLRPVTQVAVATGGSVKTGTIAQEFRPITQVAAATGGSVKTGTIVQGLRPITQVAVATGGSVKIGTIAQTLDAITQVSVGNTIYFTLHETATASSSIVEVHQPILVDTIIASEQLLAILNDSLSSTIEATGTPTFEVVINLQDSVNVSAALTADETTTLTARATVRDQLIGVATLSLTDVVNAASELITSTVVELHETVNVSGEVLTPGATYNVLLEGSVLASGDPSVFLEETLVATATAVEAITQYGSMSELLTATAEATNTITFTVASSAELSDSVLASSTVTFEGSVYYNALTDVVVVDGYPWAKDFAAIAWVLNTETLGLSTYDNFQFTSLTEYQGVLYATSPNGVYALTGDTDEGRRIDAETKFGFLDFEREQTKRVSDVFVGYTGGALELDVEVAQQVYTYLMEEREAEAPKNNRIKPGRGLSARYWRFALRNTDGANFQVYDMTAKVSASKRRL